MADPAAATRTWTIPVLGLLALALEVAAWWMAASAPVGAALVAGTVGIALALIAAWMAWRRHQSVAGELERDRRTAAHVVEQEYAATQSLREAERSRELLVTALDALPVGIAIFDPQDQQVMRNRTIDELFPGLFTPNAAQEDFATMLRRELMLGVLPDTIWQDKEWFAKRLAERGAAARPVVQRHANDRWIQAYEVRTGQGFTVVGRAEVTDQVRKEQLLAQANEQLSSQTGTDGVTGIANRRRFDQTLGTEWQRAARNRSGLSLLLVDIDHFKRYNDRYGHVAGDECLRRVTQVLSGCVRRAGELVARYGGEEFVMLLPGADVNHAVEVAQRCLRQIEQEALPHAASPTADHVTFSIGVAQVIPDAAMAPETLVNAADTAMYRAKMAGRAGYAVAELADWEIDKDAPRTRPAELK